MCASADGVWRTGGIEIVEPLVLPPLHILRREKGAHESRMSCFISTHYNVENGSTGNLRRYAIILPMEGGIQWAENKGLVIKRM